MAFDWRQLGEDFRQKYEGCFCRYRSPLTGKEEVFQIVSVEVNNNSAPNLVLHNDKHGEMFLKYTTDAELDFTFPECGYFQLDDKAIVFSRLFSRQWKKGICSGTATLTFPYPGGFYAPRLDCGNLNAAFKRAPVEPISQAIQRLKEQDLLSTPVSPVMAVGLGRKQELWLWHETSLIGQIDGNTLSVKVPAFQQEVVDHIRDTGDRGAIKVI